MDWQKSRKSDIIKLLLRESKKRGMIEQFLRESNKIEGVTDDTAYLDSRTAWDKMLTYKQMSFGMIVEAHLLLMENINEDIAGMIREVDVQVGGRVCPPYEEVRDLLRK